MTTITVVVSSDEVLKIVAMHMARKLGRTWLKANGAVGDVEVKLKDKPKK